MRFIERIESSAGHSMKIKRVPISMDVFFHMLRDGYSWKVERGIPSDAQYRGFTVNQDQTIYVWIEHDSFPKVSPGNLPPEFLIAFAVYVEDKIIKSKKTTEVVKPESN